MTSRTTLAWVQASGIALSAGNSSIKSCRYSYTQKANRAAGRQIYENSSAELNNFPLCSSMEPFIKTVIIVKNVFKPREETAGFHPLGETEALRAKQAICGDHIINHFSIRSQSGQHCAQVREKQEAETGGHLHALRLNLWNKNCPQVAEETLFLRVSQVEPQNHRAGPVSVTSCFGAGIQTQEYAIWGESST